VEVRVLSWAPFIINNLGAYLKRLPFLYGKRTAKRIDLDVQSEVLLFEIEDLARTLPDIGVFSAQRPQGFEWTGRFSAAVEEWNAAKSLTIPMATSKLFDPRSIHAHSGYADICVLLNYARASVRLKTVGPVNEAIEKGAVFYYFDEIRKIIELARQDILFVDRYLDAAFVARYLPHVATGVPIRLLTIAKSVDRLLPAVQAFAAQHGARISVRVAGEIHDRNVLIDGNSCYQSGASFKDGAINSPTTVTQITDAFPAVKKTYEDIWTSAEARA
jgi:hypothetical protein